MTPTNDAPVTVEPDWLNADTCIENMRIAYDDATEDEDETPVDTVVSAGDLGVLIGLAEYAVRHRLAALASAPAGDGVQTLSADEMEAHPLGAPWHARQPIEDLAKTWRGRPWVPLEAAIAALQFWQRRDYEHSVAALARPRAAVGERDKQLDQHSTALVNLSEHVLALRSALTMARDLIDTIEQTPGNVWWVKADDPETAVCDTFSAIEAALQSPPAKVEG